MRAFTACINQSNPKVDIVNMSYGEPTSMPNKGRIIDLLREMVNQHKVETLCFLAPFIRS